MEISGEKWEVAYCLLTVGIETILPLKCLCVWVTGHMYTRGCSRLRLCIYTAAHWDTHSFLHTNGVIVGVDDRRQ